MPHGFTPALQLFQRTAVRKRRELPVAGRTLVAVGSKVTFSQIVAEALLPGELHIMRVAEKMGIEPFEVVKGLRIGEGQEVEEGALLCEHSGLLGLFKSRFKAPVAGKIEFITQHSGHVGIRMAPQAIKLSAFISGIVVGLSVDRAVEIESEAALIQGIFGVGGERNGKLKMLDVPRGRVVEENDIPADAAGCVLVGGTRPSLGALRKASAIGAAGLISGGLDDRALAGYLDYDLGIALTGDEDIPLTLIATEGFGALPISERVLGVLGGLEGQFASINGATQVRAGAVRPEIIVCYEDRVAARIDTPELSRDLGLGVGSRVRIIRVPYFGLFGQVVEMPVAAERIETGAMTRVLKARLEDGRIVSVPRANVELV